MSEEDLISNENENPDEGLRKEIADLRDKVEILSEELKLLREELKEKKSSSSIVAPPTPALTASPVRSVPRRPPKSPLGKLCLLVGKKLKPLADGSLQYIDIKEATKSNSVIS